jgi:copper(I)-binding protein
MIGVGRAAAGAVALILVAAACGGSSGATSVAGRLGDLTVTDAYMPAPASPAVAAVYLTVHNSGSLPQVLLSISTPDAETSRLMTEIGNGSMGTMSDLAELAIPAKGQASLTPGHDHGMLENPTVTLKVGQHVPVTLHFDPAGTLTISVPVVPLTDILGGP